MQGLHIALQLSLVVLDSSHKLQQHNMVLQAYTLFMCEHFVVLKMAVLGGLSYTIIE